jgi:hypothetical protein
MTTSHLRVAVIVWGSLTWDETRPLKRRGNWRKDGPILPIEFARVTTQDGRNKARVSLVILPGAHPVMTYWTELDVTSIHKAREHLAGVEGVTAKDRLSRIGFWSPQESFGRVKDVTIDIGIWANAIGLDGAVWTDLKPNLPDDKAQRYSMNLPAAVIQQIERHGSNPVWLSEARDYVEKAPLQITTLCRGAMNERFGWSYRSTM